MTSLDLGRLERKLLTLLQYNVSLKSSVYVQKDKPYCCGCASSQL